MTNHSPVPPPIGQGAPGEKKPLAALVSVPLFHVTACTSQMVRMDSVF